MATNLPIIETPESPTSQTEDGSTSGLGVSNVSQLSSANVAYDPNALSPIGQQFQFGSMSVPMSSPASVYSSLSVDSAGNPKSGRSEDGSGPFNFQPTTLAKSPVVKSNIGQRRGHKYKHSSVSHQIFLEPPPRAPRALPTSLPVPTFAEYRASMSREQKTRFYWSLCHILIAAYVLWSAHGSQAMTALSHLLFYDSIGALLCVVVDVLSNFDVWKRSSVRHPFGLERVEVLAGFAMAVLLMFMGGDLLSHTIKHATEDIGGHSSHRAHGHERVSPGAVDVTAVLAIGATLVSAIGLKNHARIGKAMRFGSLARLPSVLSNPSHFLTLSCSTLLVLLPLLSWNMYSWVDKMLSCSMAVAMMVLGLRLVATLGAMLLMSYSGDVTEVIKDMETDPLVTKVEDAKIWQVHYGLCMANLRLRVRGTEDNLLRLRERMTSLVRNRLAGGYGGGSGQKWEVTVQFIMDDA